jgi:solute carrier family 35, member F5
MVITLSSDYIYVLAMLKTTPLVVTVGLSLTIPLAVLGDGLLGQTPHGQVLLGAVLVLVGFIVIGIEDSRLQEKRPADLHDDSLSDGQERNDS